MDVRFLKITQTAGIPRKTWILRRVSKMSVGIFIILFWLGFERFEVKRELKPVAKREWKKLYRREKWRGEK
jgi:hypothetical protein